MTADTHLAPAHRTVLLDIAVAAVREAATTGRAPNPDLASVDAELRVPGASFVTLLRGGRLRGCIGSLEARRPLAHDVAQNAAAASLHDPRMERVTPEELDDLTVKVSVLTPPEPLAVGDRAELLERLRPGVDGLVIEAGSHRATFLPSVWEQLPDPDDFVDHLWTKAGLATGTWPTDLRVERYRTEEFGTATDS